jgi:hypothetical protein
MKGSSPETQLAGFVAKYTMRGLFHLVERSSASRNTLKSNMSALVGPPAIMTLSKARPYVSCHEGRRGDAART